MQENKTRKGWDCWIQIHLYLEWNLTTRGQRGVSGQLMERTGKRSERESQLLSVFEGTRTDLRELYLLVFHRFIKTLTEPSVGCANR